MAIIASLLFLLFLHHLADVAFQPSWLIANKHKHIFSIYEHAFVWAGTVSVGLYALGIFSLWKFFFLLLVHWLIDYIKYQKLPDDYYWIYPDQALHYLQILTVFFIK